MPNHRTMRCKICVSMYALLIPDYYEKWQWNSAILTKTDTRLARQLARALPTLCDWIRPHGAEDEDEQYPASEMHVIARKRCCISNRSSWFSMRNLMRLNARESAWSNCGFTYHDALKTCGQGICFDKCRKESWLHLYRCSQNVTARDLTVRAFYYFVNADLKQWLK